VEWVFIALVVAVVAAVAMVVVGRGGGLAPALPDRPDVELPSHRHLTPNDLAQVRLSVAVRGYRMDEVDALLARLGAELAARDDRPDDSPGDGSDRSLPADGIVVAVLGAPGSPSTPPVPGAHALSAAAAPSSAGPAAGPAGNSQPAPPGPLEPEPLEPEPLAPEPLESGQHP